jgi:hypothetical protein
MRLLTDKNCEFKLTFDILVSLDDIKLFIELNV